jgi:predicted O-linked N-acetylglucosamine transferase (SPINDLY family)
MPRFHLLYQPIIKTIIEIEKKADPNRILLGSLNKEGKTNKLVLNTWKTILKRCPTTMMLIRLDLLEDIPDRIEFYVKNLDCEKSRLIFVSNVDDEEYFGLFKKIDILLDTFPYSGTTTSCNALFHSTPIVTMYKKGIHAHNMTSSLLINMGFPELVTYSTEEYIEKTVELINTPDKIDEYRTTIKDIFLGLMEPEKFIQEYESLLLGIYNDQKPI